MLFVRLAIKIKTAPIDKIMAAPHKSQGYILLVEENNSPMPSISSIASFMIIAVEKKIMAVDENLFSIGNTPLTMKVDKI